MDRRTLSIAAIGLLLAVAGGVSLNLAIRSLHEEQVYRKDFLQEYLLGKALLDGVNPYLPLPQLAKRYLGDLPDPVFPHPTPHPPPMALVGLPFATLSYPDAAAAWLILELLVIVVSIGVLMRQMGIQPRPILLLVVVLGFVGTDAFLLELVLGQVQSLLLLLVALAWIALRERRDWMGGAALGAVFAIKFVGWPLLLFLLLRRRWKAVVSSTAAVVGVYCVSALALGPELIIHYFRDVAPSIASIYQTDPLNSSLATIGWRLFSGAEPSALLSFSAPPLVRWPFGALGLSMALPVLFSLGAIMAARRLNGFDAGFALLVCTSMLVNPIAWPHYTVLATMAILWIWMRLDTQLYPRAHTYLAILLTAALFIPSRLYVLAAISLGGRRQLGTGIWEVALLPSLTTLAPTAILLSICILLWRVEAAWDRSERLCAS